MKAVSLVCSDALTIRGTDGTTRRKPGRHALPIWLIGLGLIAACTDNPAPDDSETCFTIPANAQIIAAPPAIAEDIWNNQGTHLQGATPSDPHGQGTELQGNSSGFVSNQGTG